MKTIVVSLVVLTLFAPVFFGWGFFTHRNRVFPYLYLRGLITAMPAFVKDEVDPGLRLDAIHSLPYITGTPVKGGGVDTESVVLYDKERAWTGYNLFSSRHTNDALLVDMRGRVMHRWQYDGSLNWAHVELLKGGGLLAIEDSVGLVRLDKDSNVIFDYKAQCHHDATVGPDGNVYVLEMRIEPHPGINKLRPIRVDYITVLSPTGERLREYSVLDIVRDSEFRGLLDHPEYTRLDYPIDMFHTNNVEVFDGSLAGVSPELYKKGNILFSCRNLDLIGIYDPQRGELVWGWGPGELYRQHNPSLTGKGTIIVFDNGEATSRVVELDPLTGEIKWTYGERGSELFFSGTRGGAQRLKNGNTLITVSDSSTAFEVTPDGEVVWKFVNAHTFKDENGETMRDTVYRMTRVGPDVLRYFD